MFGSPFLIKVNGQYKVIGLLHGGPASPIHFYTSKILSDLSSPSIADIDNFIGYIEKKIKYHVKTFKNY
jgi:hypothetical protein